MKQIFTNFVAIDNKKISKKDIYVEDGKIVEKFEKDNCEIIDCNGLFLFPSFCDLHVHFRDPGFTYKEDLETGSLSALKGGYTTVNLMANTNPIVSSVEIYNDIINRSKKLDLIDIYQSYSITENEDGKTLDHLDFMPKDVKFISDDGHGVDDDYTMYLAMKKAKELSVNMTLHEEVKNLSSIDYRIAEDLMTIRDCYLSYVLNKEIHFSHVSTQGSIKAIEYFKKLGADITCEVTPHHIYFSNRNDLKVNPPIREERDRKALINAIQNNIVDAISTDHAPHSKEDKEKSAPGYIGLESAFAICYKALVETGYISLNKLIDIMSTKPCEILKIKKGKIECGYDADFTLVDLDCEKYIYSVDDIVSKSKNSPYIGETFSTRIKKVFKKGVLKYEYN